MPTQVEQFPYFEVSVETDDGKEQVAIKVFDSTVELARQIEGIFEATQRRDDLKKYTTIKIKRK